MQQRLGKCLKFWWASLPLLYTIAREKNFKIKNSNFFFLNFLMKFQNPNSHYSFVVIVAIVSFGLNEYST